jgi:hypothetical protein
MIGEAVNRTYDETVRCGECRHFEPDHLNPETGIGDCRKFAVHLTSPPLNRAHERGPMPAYPKAERRCALFRPMPGLMVEEKESA